MNKMNSKEYWEKRFDTLDWKSNCGQEQTDYFSELFLRNLPKKIEKYLARQKSLCDWGCANGQAANRIKSQFENMEVTGIDISESAISTAKSLFPNCNFIAMDLFESNKKYDVIFASNVLEHFVNPFEIIQKLENHVNNMLIAMIPFKEKVLIEEHFSKFDYKNTPQYIDELKLIAYKTIECTPIDGMQCWSGYQLLLIYVKTEALLNINPSLELMAYNDIELSTNKKELSKTTQELSKTTQELSKTTQELSKTTQELNAIYKSKSWLVIKFLKKIKLLYRYGLLEITRKSYFKIKNYLIMKLKYYHHKNQLKEIINNYPNRKIFILPVLIEWNVPLYQRPQHLAINFARQGYLYFFCSNKGQYDDIDGFTKVEDGCFITNRFDLVDSIQNKQKIYDLASTDLKIDWDFVETRLNRGDIIVYQYIDEISPEITGEVPEATYEKHYKILKDTRCIVIPTATKLENDVIQHRDKKYKLVTNGVDQNHFIREITYDQYPDTIKHIVDKEKPIIGYFGALASWFDYELVNKLARDRTNFEILLIGPDYDNSMKYSSLHNIDNITLTGPIAYQELPKYAACFTVSIIPFILNDVTESTSPIKLFEYMAMGTPIVTTDMPECRKYHSVLIGKDHENFIKQVDYALTLFKDPEYMATLIREANENNWSSKAKDIIDML